MSGRQKLSSSPSRRFTVRNFRTKFLMASEPRDSLRSAIICPDCRRRKPAGIPLRLVDAGHYAPTDAPFSPLLRWAPNPTFHYSDALLFLRLLAAILILSDHFGHAPHLVGLLTCAHPEMKPGRCGVVTRLAVLRVWLARRLDGTRAPMARVRFVPLVVLHPFVRGGASPAYSSHQQRRLFHGHHEGSTAPSLSKSPKALRGSTFGARRRGRTRVPP